MTTDHYFFALTLQNELKSHLKKLCEVIQKSFPFQRWVHYEDYHLTLAFLGHAPKETLALAIEKVANGIEGFPSFPYQLNEVGTFGKSDEPRILWVNTTNVDPLTDLRDKVFQACRQAQFQLETRPFHPHITLARKWKKGEPFIKEAIDQIFSTFVTNTMFQATEVALYRTRLHRTPKYEKINDFKLR